MIFKIVDDDGHIANAKSHLSVTSSTGETKTCHHLLANALKMEFDLYLHESRSQ